MESPKGSWCWGKTGDPRVTKAAGGMPDEGQVWGRGSWELGAKLEVR